jgi:hypothetical protein
VVFYFGWDQKEIFTEFLCDWFIAEKLKQRGPARNLYDDWIILLKERFS